MWRCTEQEPRIRFFKHGRVIIGIPRCENAKVEALDGLYGLSLGVLLPEFITGNHAIFSNLEVMTEEDRPTEPGHQRFGKFVKGVGENDHLEGFTQTVQKVAGTGYGDHILYHRLNVFEIQSVFTEDPESVLHQVVVDPDIPRGRLQRFDAGLLRNRYPYFRDKNTFQVETNNIHDDNRQLKRRHCARHADRKQRFLLFAYCILNFPIQKDVCYCPCLLTPRVLANTSRKQENSMTSRLNLKQTSPSPTAVLKEAFAEFDKIAISFSGAEDVVLIDMAMALGVRCPVFTLDTGRLHPETYRFIEDVRKHYRLDMDVLSPDPARLRRFVKEKGLFSFYEDGHRECCDIRKIGPLRQHLGTLDAWVTGQRRDQSPTREELPQRQQDTAFGSDERPLTKFNPLAAWSSADVWDYIRMNQVPYNKLHDRGFLSVGCEPCTRPVGPNQHERMGRWWWEESMRRECGLHLINVGKSGAH